MEGLFMQFNKMEPKTCDVCGIIFYTYFLVVGKKLTCASYDCMCLAQWGKTYKELTEATASKEKP